MYAAYVKNVYKNPMNCLQMSEEKKKNLHKLKKNKLKNRFKLKENNEMFGNLINEAVSEVQHKPKII